MSDKLDWNFGNEDESKAKAEIRAAVDYLLRNVAPGHRGEVALEIIEIVREVANGPPSGRPDHLDDDLPGG